MDKTGRQTKVQNLKTGSGYRCRHLNLTEDRLMRAGIYTDRGNREMDGEGQTINNGRQVSRWMWESDDWDSIVEMQCTGLGQ